jgi:hypothetical protein
MNAVTAIKSALSKIVYSGNKVNAKDEKEARI